MCDSWPCLSQETPDLSCITYKMGIISIYHRLPIRWWGLLGWCQELPPSHDLKWGHIGKAPYPGSGLMSWTATAVLRAWKWEDPRIAGLEPVVSHTLSFLSSRSAKGKQKRNDNRHIHWSKTGHGNKINPSRTNRSQLQLGPDWEGENSWEDKVFLIL